MVDYFKQIPAADAAWAVYLLSGRRLKRLIGAAVLKEWLREESELPDWLVDETYNRVGDLAETIALLLAETHTHATGDISLHQWIEEQLLALRSQAVDAQRATVTTWWATQSYEQCYVSNKLLTGALRVGVSQLLVARAVAEYALLPRALILHRMMGEWEPNEAFWNSLISTDDGEVVPSRPYPFCLASPLTRLRKI